MRTGQRTAAYGDNHSPAAQCVAVQFGCPENAALRMTRGAICLEEHPLIRHRPAVNQGPGNKNAPLQCINMLVYDARVLDGC